MSSSVSWSSFSPNLLHGFAQPEHPVPKLLALLVSEEFVSEPLLEYSEALLVGPWCLCGERIATWRFPSLDYRVTSDGPGLGRHQLRGAIFVRQAHSIITVSKS